MAEQFAWICDQLGVDPLGDGWLHQCVVQLGVAKANLRAPVESILPLMTAHARQDIDDALDSASVWETKCREAEHLTERIDIRLKAAKTAADSICQKLGYQVSHAGETLPGLMQRLEEAVVGEIENLKSLNIDVSNVLRATSARVTELEGEKSGGGSAVLVLRDKIERQKRELDGMSGDRARIREEVVRLEKVNDELRVLVDEKKYQGPPPEVAKLRELRHRLEVIGRVTRGHFCDSQLLESAGLRAEADPGKVEPKTDSWNYDQSQGEHEPPDYDGPDAAIYGYDPAKTPVHVGVDLAKGPALGTPAYDATGDVKELAVKIAATQEANRKRLGELDGKVSRGVNAFVERISKGGAAPSLAGLADAVRPFQSQGAQPSKPAKEPDVWAKGADWTAMGGRNAIVKIVEVLDPGDNAERVRFSLGHSEYVLPLDEFTKAYEPGAHLPWAVEDPSSEPRVDSRWTSKDGSSGVQVVGSEDGLVRYRKDGPLGLELTMTPDSFGRTYPNRAEAYESGPPPWFAELLGKAMKEDLREQLEKLHVYSQWKGADFEVRVVAIRPPNAAEEPVIEYEVLDGPKKGRAGFRPVLAFLEAFPTCSKLTNVAQEVGDGMDAYLSQKASQREDNER